MVKGWGLGICGFKSSISKSYPLKSPKMQEKNGHKNFFIFYIEPHWGIEIRVIASRSRNVTEFLLPAGIPAAGPRLAKAVWARPAVGESPKVLLAAGTLGGN